MFGLLNVDKPAGRTSRDIVNDLQELSKDLSMGHAGTLDPLATGVLVVCVGPATRLADYLHRYDKEYVATFLLGRQSDTEDVDGTVQLLPDVRCPSRDELQVALQLFVGEIAQRPPAYSALRVNGKRAYKLARKGRHVELPARPVQVFSVEILRYEYPELVLRVVCGSGTYIRSLGRDLAQAVGTQAVMSALTRTRIGPLLLSESVSAASLTSIDAVQQHLISAAFAIQALPQVQLTATQLHEIVYGRMLSLQLPSSEDVAAIGPDGKLAAIMAPHNSGKWRPVKNFVSDNTPRNLRYGSEVRADMA